MKPRNIEKTLCLFLLLPVVLICFQTGCQGKRRNNVSFHDAEDFRACFIAELEKISPGFRKPREYGPRAGSDRIVSMDYVYDIPSKHLAPKNAASLFEMAMKSWGKLETFEDSSSGGGGDHYSIAFGSQDSHIFIEMSAFSDGPYTGVRFLVRGLE